MAAKSKDSHVVEISAMAADTISAIQHHPLSEIAVSPGHLLLLKLWQREEDVLSRGMECKERRMAAIRSEIFSLSFFFLIFHFVFATILFTSAKEGACGRWWIPSLLSLSTSLTIGFLVEWKLCRYWGAWKLLQRERSDCRSIARGIQELRMKGARFDLSKDPLQGVRRMKSSSVECRWWPLTWCSRNLLVLCLACVGGLLFMAPKLILCV